MSPPTESAASIPLTASIRNCTAAPAAWPPGTMSEMALPASWAVTTGNHGLGAQGDALEGERAGEVGALGDEGGDEPEQIERARVRATSGTRR